MTPSTVPFNSGLWRRNYPSIGSAQNTILPPDGSAYVSTVVSGDLQNLAAGTVLFSFRSAPTGFTLVFGIATNARVSTAFTKAGTVRAGTYIARAFTVSDSGGNAADLTGNNCKTRTTDPTPGALDFRVINTTSLVAGTRTLDTNPYFSAPFFFSTSANAIGNNQSIQINNAFPIVLEPNEGIVIQTLDGFIDGTGIVRIDARVQWVEIPSW